MPTTVTVGSGLDYASVSAALTGLKTGGGDAHDFATDGIATISIQDSFADTTPFQINDTDFTNSGSISVSAYLLIEVDSANRTSKIDTSKYYVNANPGSQSAQWQIDMPYVHIKWVQFVMPSGTDASDECIRILESGKQVIIEKCLIHNNTGTSEQDGIYAPNKDTTVYIFDCVVRMSSGTRGGLHYQDFNDSCTTAAKWWIEHCTIDANGCRDGVGMTGGNVQLNVRNTMSFDANDEDYTQNTGDGVGTTGDMPNGAYANIANDTTATAYFGTTGNINSVTLKDTDTAGDSVLVESLTSGSEDYQLKTPSTGTDKAIDAAVSTAFATALPTWASDRVDTTVDIAGNARPASYTDRDVGAFEVAAGGINVTVTQASETDIAQAIGSAKQKAIGQPVESDAALSVGSSKRRSLAQAAETDAALALAAAKLKAITQAVETNTSLPITLTGEIAVALNQSTETDLAQPMSASKQRAVAQAAETDSAVAIGSAKARAIGQAAEADVAQQFTISKQISVGQAAEADVALSINLPGQISVTVAQAIETDVAQAIAKLKQRAVAQAAETDLSQPIAKVSGGTIGQTSETDAALALAVSKAIAANIAQETDGARSIGVAKSTAIGQALEVDLSRAVTVVKAISVGQAIEVDVALLVTLDGPATPVTGSVIDLAATYSPDVDLSAVYSPDIDLSATYDVAADLTGRLDNF